MSDLLDDHEFQLKTEKQKKEEPNNRLGLFSFFVFLALFVIQIIWKGSSETALVKGSYFWMPFFVTSILSFILPPKKALVCGVLTVPITFIFYMAIWPAL